MTGGAGNVTLAEAESTLTRLGVIASCDPRYLPLFEHWEAQCAAIRAKADAVRASGQRAADLAWRARLRADPEFAAMLA